LIISIRITRICGNQFIALEAAGPGAGLVDRGSEGRIEGVPDSVTSEQSKLRRIDDELRLIVHEAEEGAYWAEVRAIQKGITRLDP